MSNSESAASWDRRTFCCTALGLSLFGVDTILPITHATVFPTSRIPSSDDPTPLPSGGKEISRLPVAAQCVASAPLETHPLLLVATGDTLRCFDCQTPQQPKELWNIRTPGPPPHRDDPPQGRGLNLIHHIAWQTDFSSDRPRGFYFATAQTDQVVVWYWPPRLPLGPQLARPAPGAEPARANYNLLTPPDTVRRSVRAVCFLPPDDRYVCGASEDRMVHVWDLRDPNRKIVYSLAGHENAVYSLSTPNRPARDNKQLMLASGGADGHIMLWDIAPGKLIRSLEVPPRHNSVAVITSLAFWQDKLISASQDQTVIYVWDPSKGECVRQLEFPDSKLLEKIRGQDPPPPRKVLYERTGCGSMHVYGTYLICGEHRIRYLENAVIPGRRPEVESLPSSILVWNLENGELVGVLPGHRGSIRSLTAIPNPNPQQNPLLVSCGGGEIRLWELTLPR